MPIPRSCGSHQCAYPRLVLPTGGRSTLCYWHRLMRVSMDAQIREATRRLEAAGVNEHVAKVAMAAWPPGERWCAGCQSFVPLFYATRSRCLACSAASARTARRMSEYGLTNARFLELARLQGDRCAICRKHQRDRSIAVDHNHSTGDVRGLLCKRCNHDLLGSAFESVRILLAAAVYLTVPPAGGDWIDPEDYGDTVLRSFLASVDELSRAEAARRRIPQLEAEAARVSRNAARPE